MNKSLDHCGLISRMKDKENSTMANAMDTVTQIGMSRVMNASGVD